MSGKPEVLVERDTTGGSTPGLGWEEVKAELVQFFASIKAQGKASLAPLKSSLNRSQWK